MNKNNLYLLLSIAFIQLLGSCAEPRMPEGGPRDSQAPRISKKKYSTPDGMTNFDYKEVILTFDEWVKIQNAYSQIIISPPLQEKPSIKVKNKSVVIQWKEKLKDSTTYIIHYGDAIRDITEGNIIKNLKRAFSTGSKIDSLSISGQIVDAKTHQAKDDVLVMLYRNLADSIPLTQKPYYFSKTNPQGQFKIDYIKKGRYKIFALDDKNKDYRYNLTNESIAFLDSTFIINDSLQPNFRLRMFQEATPPLITKEKLKHFGALFIQFNSPIKDKIQLRLLGNNSTLTSVQTIENDSLWWWFDGLLPNTDNWEFEIKWGQNKLDTIKVLAQTKADFAKNAPSIRWVLPATESKDKMQLSATNKTIKPLLQNPSKDIILKFNYPIRSWDTTKIQLLQNKLTLNQDNPVDSIQTDSFLRFTNANFWLDSLQNTLWHWQADWQENKQYKIILLPHAIQDFWGRYNTDTLTRIYNINPKDKYGHLQTNIMDLDSSQQYILELINGKEKIIDSQIIKQKNSYKRAYKALPIGTYTLRIIHDQATNQRWDTGDYQQKRQPEIVVNSKKITLKAGWENEMDFSIIPNDKKTKSKLK